MYTCSLNGDILTIISKNFSWRDTKVSYWYINIRTWERSVTGKKDFKGEIYTKMSDSEIEWAKKYYLPKC